jgi:PAS domain S-box-containing protein
MTNSIGSGTDTRIAKFADAFPNAIAGGAMLQQSITSLDENAFAVLNPGSLETFIGAEYDQNGLASHIRDILHVIPQHIFILEPDQSLSFVNRSASEYLGPFQAESLTDYLRQIIHAADLDQLNQAYEAASSNEIPVEVEARVRRHDGEYRCFMHQLLPLRDECGRLLRWCGIRIDIEERKKAEEFYQRENVAMRDEIDTTLMFEGFVGSSPRLRTALTRVARVAPIDTTVLITGETGTGKELVARAIHKRSNRAHRPFVTVNCAAIPRDLIASELFGHEKGAFTGAIQRRLGRFELAEGGTLFLDEVGELPAETQVALLRVLQEREFQRVGSNHSIRANVRVIAATHRDLEALVTNGTFRQDLFYRINVFPVEVPALRDRKEDLRQLIEYFISRYSSKASKKIRSIDRKSLDRLQAYAWPGNIRELQNVIERSVILCDSEHLSVDANWLLQDQKCTQPLPQEMIATEKGRIESALGACRGRVSGPSGAAIRLGIPPSTLDSRIKALRIDKRRFQTN